MTQESFNSSEIIEIRRMLDDAMNDLRQYLDPDNDGCSVSPEARRESDLYLSTWVLDTIEGAADLIDRRVRRNEIFREEEAKARRETRAVKRHLKSVN